MFFFLKIHRFDGPTSDWNSNTESEIQKLWNFLKNTEQNWPLLFTARNFWVSKVATFRKWALGHFLINTGNFEVPQIFLINTGDQLPQILNPTVTSGPKGLLWPRVPKGYYDLRSQRVKGRGYLFGIRRRSKGKRLALPEHLMKLTNIIRKGHLSKAVESIWKKLGWC